MIDSSRILILGARAPAALEWARSLIKAGKIVFAADSVRLPVTRGVRGLSGYFHLPKPRDDVKKWGRAISDIVESRGIDVVIPTCEEVFYLSHQTPRFGSSCKLFTMPFETLRTLHDKGAFAEMTRSLPVQAPETHRIIDSDGLKRFSNNSSNWVFKPVFSRFASKTLIRPSVAAIEEITPTLEFPWVAQKFVAGRELCTYSIAVDGVLTAHRCYHPKYRVGVGSGIFFDPHDPPLIREFVNQFVREFRYTGQVGFDFIEGAEGATYVLECNPRATSGIHLFGSDRSELVSALEVNKGSTPNLSARYCIGLCMGIFGIPKYGSRVEFWRDWRRSRDAIFSWKDPLPLITQLCGLLEIACRAILERRSLAAAATSDIEWDGEELGAYQF